MKINPRPKTDGIALLIVMCAIFVLSIMAAAMAFSMKVESTLAQHTDTDQQLIWLGRSGVELARWLLAQETGIPGEPYDALNQIWAGGAGGPGETNSMLTGIDLNNYQIGDGTVSIKIMDLERFANINTAPAPELQQALTLMGVNVDEISIVTDSIQDWVQPGNMPRIAGAKNDYYQGLNPPYDCKEAPMDDISELLLVKGIWDHPEIYDPKKYAASMTGSAGPSLRHHLGFGNAPGETPNYPFGLVDLFTPFSQGRININTADRNVLQLIPGVDATVADNLLKLRAGPDGVDGTADDTPFPDAGGALRTAGDPDPRAGNLVATHSATFRVTVTARLGGYTRDFNAILFRTGRTVQVVGFYWNY
jgi:type II secretory pathway component PulK